MSEAHNNTVPDKRGSYNISSTGIVYYFPVQEAGFLKPLLSLVLINRPNGEISCCLDIHWSELKGMDE